MRVIKPSGYRKISIGLTAKLTATLSWLPVTVAATVIIGLLGRMDDVTDVSTVLNVLFSGVAFLSDVYILSGLVECGEDLKPIKRAKLFVLIHIILYVINIIFEGLSFTDYSVEILNVVVSVMYALYGCIGMSYIISGFGEIWHAYGGDEKTARKIKNLRLQYCVSTTMIFLIVVIILVYAVATKYEMYLAERYISAIKWAAFCVVMAFFPLAAWKTVVHFHIARMSIRITRTIMQISGGGGNE